MARASAVVAAAKAADRHRQMREGGIGSLAFAEYSITLADTRRAENDAGFQSLQSTSNALASVSSPRL